MSQTIKLKRGLETNRPNITPVDGELIFTTDNIEVFFGDGLVAGGKEIGYLNTRTGGAVNGPVTLNSAVTIAAGDENTNVFEVLDSEGAALFEVTQTGDAIIGGKLTVNGDGQSSFAGDVLIGGSLTVNGDATVAVDLSADSLTVTGDLQVNGNTALGNEATDTTTIIGATNITGVTTVNSTVSIAAGDANENVFEVLDSEGAALFEVTETGDAIIAGVLTVNGDGQSSFSGDVLIGGSLQVNGDATVAVDLSADSLTVTGDLQVNGNTTLGNEPTDTTTINGVTTINGNTSIVGDLIVTGTTTTVNSNEVNIGDAIILLNSDETGAPTENGGIEIERGIDDNVALFWNETADAWYITKDDGAVSSVRLLDTDDLADVTNAVAAQNLGEHADTNFTDVATSDMIMWSGTEWINSSTIDGGTF
jgi:cytoskeletal protein CcmA (bactofilin family)